MCEIGFVGNVEGAPEAMGALRIVARQRGDLRLHLRRRLWPSCRGGSGPAWVGCSMVGGWARLAPS